MLLVTVCEIGISADNMYEAWIDGVKVAESDVINSQRRVLVPENSNVSTEKITVLYKSYMCG